MNRLVVIFTFILLASVARAQMIFPIVNDTGGSSAGATVALNFAANAASGCTSIASCISVTRSTQETCEPVNGVLTYASANTACITATGIQNYAAGTNLVPQSQATTGWSVSNGLITTGAANTAPDLTASQLVYTDNATSGNHNVTSGNFSATIGTIYTSSIYAKTGTCTQSSNECRFISFGPASGLSTAFVGVDLTQCAITGGNPFTIATTAIPLANGWCHIYMTWKAIATGAGSGAQMYMQPGPPYAGSKTAPYVGTGSTILFWGAQAQATTLFLPYCPTAGASATCNADSIADTGTLKTVLESAALRVVVTTAQQQTNGTIAGSSALLGVGSGLYGIGMSAGYNATTNWPAAATLTSGGMAIQGRGVNYYGLSANASGRSLALNGQTANSDSNGLSASAQEYIGSLSSGGNCNCVISNLQVWNTRSDAAMLSTTANSAMPALVASYTGPVANHTEIAQGVLAAGTATQAMSRTHHKATENITALAVRFPNYQVQNNSTETEIGPGGAATITASVEYPSGTCTAITFSAAAQGSIANNGFLVSDSLTLTIPTGADFWVRSYRTNAAGIIYNGTSEPPPDGNNGETMTYGVSGVADQTTTCGAVTATAANSVYYPEAIVGPTKQKSYCLMGDSRNKGYNDAYSDSYDRIGELDRWVGANYSTLSMAAGGDSAQFYIASHTNRQSLLGYCTGMIVEYMSNDVWVNAETAPTIETNLQTIYGYNSQLVGGTGPVWQSTTMSRTTSTDTFATVANQSHYSASWSIIVTVDQWVRANTAAITGYFENANVVQTSPDSGIFNATGLAQGWTSDGLHFSQYGYMSVANSHGRPVLQ